MNSMTDAKTSDSRPAGSPFPPETNQAAGLATATGILTVDLDAIIARSRLLWQKRLCQYSRSKRDK